MLFTKSRTGLISFRASKPNFTVRVASNPPPPPQTAPICGLPVEIVQEIASYLTLSDTAAFCLSSRYMFYVFGTAHLTNYLQSGDSKYTQPSKIQRRKNIEILERAFSSHWYCAWCDKFHAHDKAGGPKATAKETKRDCAKYNSYLYAGKSQGHEYILTYHHVRLAINHALWGPDYGIPLDALHYHNECGTAKVHKMQVPTSMWCIPAIRSGRLILHATFQITLPVSIFQDPEWLAAVWPALPQIVVGHRDSQNGHTGLKATLLRGKLGKQVQLCSLCATDYFVMRTRTTATSPTGEDQVQILIDTHRDLGDGKTPFDASWRAHGEIGDGIPGFGGDVVRLLDFRAGDIKKMFEADELPLRNDKADDEITKALSALHKRHKRTQSFLNGELSLTQEIIQQRSSSAWGEAGTLVQDNGRSGRHVERRRNTEAVGRLKGRTYWQRVA